MTEFAHAGTLIHGTHRPQDLIPAFMGTLEELDAARAGRIRATFPSLTADATLIERGWCEGEASDLIETLFEALDACAPEGWTFGAHEGDGADFGFWPVEQDSIGTVGTWANDA